MKVPHQTDEKTKRVPTWLNFIIGGTSGMMATSIVQPMDLLKTRMQLADLLSKKSNMFQVARGILKNEGLKGFYKGLTAALFRQATYTTARLGFFTGFVDYYKTRHGVPSFMAKIWLGMTAGGIAACIGTPAEVCLIRMTADGRLPPEDRKNYSHVFNTLARITREEGFTGLFRGVGPTVSRSIVVNGAQLGSYTQAREMLQPSLGDGLPLHTAAATIAGLVTSVASMPVDIVKTRMQNSIAGTTQWAMLTNVVKNEGVLTLWRGLLPTYAKIGPHTVLVFIFLEQFKNLYFNLTEKKVF